MKIFKKLKKLDQEYQQMYFMDLTNVQVKK